MPKPVRPEQYLGKIGWKSCLDRHELRSRSFPDSRWGYWVLLKDIVEIELSEERYIEKHGALPQIVPQKRKPTPRRTA